MWLTFHLLNFLLDSIKIQVKETSRTYASRVHLCAQILFLEIPILIIDQFPSKNKRIPKKEKNFHTLRNSWNIFLTFQKSYLVELKFQNSRGPETRLLFLLTKCKHDVFRETLHRSSRKKWKNEKNSGKYATRWTNNRKQILCRIIAANNSPRLFNTLAEHCLNTFGEYTRSFIVRR